MQTLTRPSHSKQRRPATSPGLTSGIPSPFPREQFLQTQQATNETSTQLDDRQAGPSHTDSTLHATSNGLLHDLMPSIAYVQKSCIMTLNNLLSMPMPWSPIVPDRRHSLPSVAETSEPDLVSPSSALQTLVTNLRNRAGAGDMIEIHTANNDIELMNELRTHVENVSPSLDPEDATLVSSLVSLLSHFDHLSKMQFTSSHSINRSQTFASWEPAASSDMFTLLKQQLADLQFERLSLQPELLAPGAPPVLAVEAMLLWHRIDEELENVVAMCKERAENIHKYHQDHLPPQYDMEDYQYEMPPQYEDSGKWASIDSSKLRPSSHPLAPTSRPIDDKMRLDLENVAMAIDRLYLVAPQLHNQRVELKSSKLAQLEKAKREGNRTSQARGKQKERDVGELENMLELLAKASERSLHNQSVVLEGGLQGMSDKARRKDVAKKEAFVQQLANHSTARRLHNQDAMLPSRTKDPEALLTLPEFIREPLPVAALTRLRDPNALLTLPEFVKEHPVFDEIDSERAEIKKKKHRLRSSSAPSLTWLLSSAKSGSASGTLSHIRSRSRFNSPVPTSVGFEVSYIAESHENLHHVLAFFTAAGATPGADLEAEARPAGHGEGSDRILITSGPRTSLPLILPARVLPGKHVVRVQSGHFEVKMATIASSTSPGTAEQDLPPLLDAAQLSSADPTSFICASCSLSLVQTTKVKDYRDLPSEHWAELVEAWMCHSDQKLHEEAVKHGQLGFWPEPGQGLVGGSYILFEESCVTLNNLHVAEENKHGEDWRLARCLCGAVIGRCQDHPVDNGSKRLVFRLLKFAIRPVSLTTEPLRIPLSAFIVEDMIELVQAHATYRFVILDEEEEAPRILIWLFKPSIRIAYATSTAYSIPKRASIHAAKVLYRMLTPTERSGDLKTTLQRYPGFPQAEYLFYPMPICRRLANLLSDSNVTYPEGMREMTGLQVGWLHRA